MRRQLDDRAFREQPLQVREECVRNVDRVALTRSAYSNAMRSRSDKWLDSCMPSAASICSCERPALSPTAALMSIQKGQPLRAATRMRAIWIRFRPTAHRPEPKIMLDRNEASIVRE